MIKLISSLCVAVFCMLVSGSAKANWSNCKQNGGTALCIKATVANTWRLGNGPRWYPRGGYPCDANAEVFANPDPNLVYDSTRDYEQNTNTAGICSLDYHGPRSIDCNLRIPSIGVYNEDLFFPEYVGQFYLAGKSVLKITDCAPYVYHGPLTGSSNGTIATTGWPLWKEISCPIGSPLVNPIGDLYCYSDTPPKDPLEENKEPDCSRAGGNPIDIASGNKFQRELDYTDAYGRLKLERYYTSSVPVAGSFGRYWRSNFDAKLFVDAGASPAMVTAFRPQGAIVSYALANGSYLPQSTDVQDTLRPILDGQGAITGWLYKAMGSSTEEVYSVAGDLTKYVASDGYTQNITRDAWGKLLKVTDSNDRFLNFEYLPAVPRVSRITDSVGNAIGYGYDYDAGDYSWLNSTTNPNGMTKNYVAESAGVNQYRLARINDEKGGQFAAFSYDSLGLAIGTQHAGGVESFQVSRTLQSDGSVLADISDGGFASNRVYAKVNGKSRLTRQSQPAGSGCSASSSALQYDANGYVSVRDDFNGNRICISSDLARNLPLVRLEGLSAQDACSGYLLQGAALPAGSRKRSMQYHPSWNVVTRLAEPLKITTTVYHGQPDPTNGNAVLSCASGASSLPSGSPIAVKCKVIEQATTDADGSRGFAATLDSAVPSRVQAFQYDASGNLVSLTNAAGKTTTFEYFTATNSSVHKSDLKKVTNPIGQVAQATSYTVRGQALSATDVKGVVTTNTYDAAGRLITTTIDGDVTTFTYDDIGLLTKVVSPDTSEANFSYDTAHRLTKIADKSGNSVSYTLDAAGNRVREEYSDPNGTLKRWLERSTDALNRVYHIKG